MRNVGDRIGSVSILANPQPPPAEAFRKIFVPERKPGTFGANTSYTKYNRENKKIWFENKKNWFENKKFWFENFKKSMFDTYITKYKKTGIDNYLNNLRPKSNAKISEVLEKKRQEHSSMNI